MQTGNDPAGLLRPGQVHRRPLWLRRMHLTDRCLDPLFSTGTLQLLTLWLSEYFLPSFSFAVLTLFCEVVIILAVSAEIT